MIKEGIKWTIKEVIKEGTRMESMVRVPHRTAIGAEAAIGSPY